MTGKLTVMTECGDNRIVGLAAACAGVGDKAVLCAGRSFCTFGVGLIVMTECRNFFVGCVICAAVVLAFFVFISRFGACGFLCCDIIAENVIIRSAYCNGIFTGFVCVFVGVSALIGFNLAVSADVVNR